MNDFSAMSPEELLKAGGHLCACGRVHACGLKSLKIGPGAVHYIKAALDTLGCKKPFIVCDLNTKAAAWDKVRAVLDKEQISYVFFCIGSRQPEPDEHTLGSLTMAFDPSCDVVLGIGSGVINDTCKALAHAIGCPSMIVGTAPSMDGYASNSSSMIQNGVKVSLYNACPQAIIADTDIMKNAPDRMLWAGLGDMLAKYISVCEWRISHLITGEYYCENIADLMRCSLRKIVSAAPLLMARDPQTIQAVVEGLVLSGVAMSFAEISRPASGLEHYFSHLWEMMALERGLPYDLHGIQVGVGTWLTLKIYDKIKVLKPTRERAETFINNFSQQAWEQSVREIFGGAADTVLALEDEIHKNDPVRHQHRLSLILAHWGDIQQIIDDELPQTRDIELLMQSLGMPIKPEDIGISGEDVCNALIGSRDIRDKYLTSSLLWDLGILYEFKEKLAPSTPMI